MGFLISHKSGEQRRALLPERRESFMQSTTREECLMMQANSLIALMQLHGTSNIEMITEEGSELSSSILCRMWAGKHMLMSPNNSRFSTIRSRRGCFYTGTTCLSA